MATTEMQAGPALDTRVANVVFGREMAFWRRREDSPTSGEPRWERCAHDAPGAFWVDGDPAGEWRPDRWTMVPPFSTEGNAMLYLIERMHGQGWDYTITSTVDDGYIACNFQRRDNDWVHGAAWGKSAPHAVALAALKALNRQT